MPLLRRMAVVLRAEGEDLVADNISTIPATRRRSPQAHRCPTPCQARVVERFQWIGAGVVSVTPLPVVDLLATAVNAQMVVEIGRIYGCELNLERGRELALSCKNC